MEIKLLELQTKIKYTFKDINLLKTAITHKSYAYDSHKTEPICEYNERIEFLGDAILEHVISDLLYNNASKYSEGNMSKMRAMIVCEASLSRALKENKMEEYIILGKCEQVTDGKHKDAIIADMFEAIVGAIYIDGGYEEAKKFILRLLKVEIEEVLDGTNVNIDYKTKLQEELQKNGTVKIEYVLVEESGLEHEKTFLVDVLFNDKKIGEGRGKNKKQAEQAAAKAALEKNKVC